MPGHEKQEAGQPTRQTGTAQAIPLAEGQPGAEAPAGQPQNLDASIEADLHQGLDSLPPYRQAAYLDAARKLVDAGRLDDAETVLEQIDVGDLPPVLSARKHLLRAQIHFRNDDLDAALRFVDAELRIQNVDPTYVSSGLDLEARIQLRQGHPLEAAKTWIKRDNYLTDPDDIRDNDMRVWFALGHLNDLQLQLAESGGISDDLKGWLDLATLYLEFQGDSYGLRTAVTEWSDAHQSQPAAGFAATLLGPPPDQGVHRIALLLPLSSNFGAAAQTVYNGFQAASQTDSDPGRPNVVFYDIGSEPSLAANYFGAAVAEGADVIVGPLGKSAVNALLDARKPEKPTVLLGGSSEDHPLPPQVYQFDLAPEPEARQVAELMYATGHRRVGALYPDDEWGQRVYDAFVARWKALGGTLAGAQSYSPKSDDFSVPIKTLLNLTQSDNRKAFVENVTGLHLQFEARRRQDIDAIFMAARPAEARLIKPQINFFHGLNLPVYSTSDVYSGTPDKVKDTDLDGVIFPDMPWLLSNTARTGGLKTKLEDAGYSNVSTKLFAFGFDAYRLARLAPGPSLAGGARLYGMTSVLTVGPDSRLHRGLEWAKFIDGVPVRLWTH